VYVKKYCIGSIKPLNNGKREKMALIQLDPDKIIDYVPEFDRANTTDPLIIRCKYVPRKLALEYADIIARSFDGVMDQQKRIQIERACNKDQFCKQVVEIVNYTAEGGGPITDPAEFYDSVDGTLIFEILDAMVTQSKLTEGQRKN
jgi:hypothetical protein